MNKFFYIFSVTLLFFSCSSNNEEVSIAFLYDEVNISNESIIEGLSLALDLSVSDKSYRINEMNLKDSDTAKSIHHKLEKKNIDAVFVSINNNSLLDKIIGITTDMNIPIIDPINEKTEYRNKSDNLFFITPSLVEEAELLAWVVVEDYIRKVSIIRDQNYFDSSYGAKFKDNFGKAGGKIIGEIVYSPSDNSDINEICRTASRGTEAVLVLAPVEETINIIKSINSSTSLRHYYIPSRTVFNSARIISAFENEEIQLKFVSRSSYKKTEDSFQVFLKNYKMTYEKEPDYWSEYSYIAALMLYTNYIEKKQNNLTFSETMLNGAPIQILDSGFKWDSTGDPEYIFYSFELQDSNFNIKNVLSPGKDL